MEHATYTQKSIIQPKKEGNPDSCYTTRMKRKDIMLREISPSLKKTNTASFHLYDTDGAVKSIQTDKATVVAWDEVGGEEEE